MTKITVVEGDITQEKTDAIVNAADKLLLGGGGVDGAIHIAAGPDLLEECRTLNGCKTGEAKITKGYDLPAKYVIHTVGPICGNEDGREPELLSSCYLNSLLLAKQNYLKTISFPAISTGVFGYPKEKAIEVVFNTLNKFIEQDNSLTEIRLVVHSKEDKKLYDKYFSQPPQKF